MIMTPKAKEQRSAGELEEDTCTRRKRSRRVSFAEPTTVHFFNRDDESESPANSTPVPSEGCGLSDNEGSVGFGGAQSQGDDSVESAREDEGEDGARLRFVKDIDLSSPGSAVGSVTSNEGTASKNHSLCVFIYLFFDFSLLACLSGSVCKY